MNYVEILGEELFEKGNLWLTKKSDLRREHLFDIATNLSEMVKTSPPPVRSWYGRIKRRQWYTANKSPAKCWVVLAEKSKIVSQLRLVYFDEYYLEEYPFLRKIQIEEVEFFDEFYSVNKKSDLEKEIISLIATSHNNPSKKFFINANTLKAITNEQYQSLTS